MVLNEMNQSPSQQWCILAMCFCMLSSLVILELASMNLVVALPGLCTR